MIAILLTVALARVADLCRSAAKALDARLLTAARAYVERAAPTMICLLARLRACDPLAFAAAMGRML